MRCECCTRYKLTTAPVKTMFAGNEYKTNLCQECKELGHFVSFCNGCLAKNENVMVWPCGHLDHVSRIHPGIIEREENRPEEEPPKLPRKIGTLQL